MWLSIKMKSSQQHSRIRYLQVKSCGKLALVSIKSYSFAVIDQFIHHFVLHVFIILVFVFKIACYIHKGQKHRCLSRILGYWRVQFRILEVSVEIVLSDVKTFVACIKRSQKWHWKCDNQTLFLCLCQDFLVVQCVPRPWLQAILSDGTFIYFYLNHY